MSQGALNRIDKQLQGLNPESLRYQTLLALKRFRSSWVELGQLLTDVAYGGDYKEWGYEDFEIYCARELGLKKPTVKKLMISYNYMKKHEPTRLATAEDGDDTADALGGGYDVPDYQTVELLHRARESGDEEQAEKLHEMAFSGEEDEGVLRKQIREYLKPAETSERIADANSARGKELNDILRTARALRRKLLQANSVPAGIRERFEQVLLELEALD